MSVCGNRSKRKAKPSAKNARKTEGVEVAEDSDALKAGQPKSKKRLRADRRATSSAEQQPPLKARKVSGLGSPGGAPAGSVPTRKASK